MRIHTSLSQDQIYSALPTGVSAHVSPHGSRKRERAYEVTLYVWKKDELHRRYGNSGGYGASEVSATWDEWGVWMSNLYVLDPDALIGYYKDPIHFDEETRRYRDSVRTWNKPGSVAVKTHTAPWLNADRKESQT